MIIAGTGHNAFCSRRWNSRDRDWKEGSVVYVVVVVTAVVVVAVVVTAVVVVMVVVVDVAVAAAANFFHRNSTRALLSSFFQTFVQLGDPEDFCAVESLSLSLSLFLSLSLSVFLIVLFEKGRRRERSVFNLMQLHCCCQCCCCCSCCCKCCCPGFFVLNSGRTTIAKKQLWSPLLQPRIRRGQ